MKASDATPRHPIRVAAQRTGLTPATLRAWERRYAAVGPSRSDGGQRLYSDSDITRLDTLRKLTKMGRPIGTVANLSEAEIGALLTEDRAAAVGRGESSRGEDPGSVLDRAYGQVFTFDGIGLERTLWHAAMSLDGQALLDDVVAPLLERIGVGWESGDLTPGEEHLASDVIDKVLARLADLSRQPEGPSLVVATLPGERHGLGARLATAAAIVEGWRAMYLGTDLPVAHIALVAKSVAATAVGISVVSRDHLDDTTRDLTMLRELLDPAVDILIGGRGAKLLGADRLPRGVMVVDGLEGLRQLCRDGR